MFPLVLNIQLHPLVIKNNQAMCDYKQLLISIIYINIINVLVVDYIHSNTITVKCDLKL